jgi:mono/diheme cytochrome c family protein
MTKWKRIAGITLAISAATAALLGGAAIYIGVYDVSATSQHTGFVYHLLETSLRRSVKLRTSGIQVPALDGPERVVNGFKQFDANCVQCHGAPGIAPQRFALGLRPAPASLVEAASEWPTVDVYWIVRHGIKMSGMPAWQYRMSDEEIWDVVAFMKILPELSPADYEKWTRQHISPTRAGEAEVSVASSQDLRLGDAGAGRRAVQQYLCATCHVIPGIVGANKHVGPSLAGIANRQYIAGVLPNTPANMLRWLRDPRKVDPLSAMPDLGVSGQDARDIAAFLYTLRDDE